MKITDFRVVLDDFMLYVDELHLEPGHIYGLIGANGCGKTTLLNAAAGLRSGYSGEIDYEGLSPQDITFVPRRSYMMHTTVYQNLVYPLGLRKLPVDEAETTRCLDMLGLKAGQYAPGLSGGQRQKLALMRAMLFTPKLIFLDEAFSNMDMESVELFERLIAEYQSRTPAAWLIAGHQIAGIANLCEYVYFMHEGRIAERGLMQDVLTRPASEALARYLRRETICETNTGRRF